MKMILLYGPPAAGKLTVAKELAALTGYVLLDNHSVTDNLLQLFPRTSKEYDVARAKVGRKIRLLLYEAAAQNGINLIITFAPLADGAHDYIRSIQAAVQDAGGELCLVQLSPSQQVLEQRVTGESRTGGKVQSAERLQEMYAEFPVMFEQFPDTDHLIIDNSELSPAQVAQQIVAHYGLTIQ